mmetsp:Transcript_11873/g.34931  ORF Transcript_11873/g.34931 Transcript_11873/m.34931 type:complete len:148 (+) Transcript_11873:686-1129(+)
MGSKRWYWNRHGTQRRRAPDGRFGAQHSFPAGRKERKGVIRCMSSNGARYYRRRNVREGIVFHRVPPRVSCLMVMRRDGSILWERHGRATIMRGMNMIEMPNVTCGVCVTSWRWRSAKRQHGVRRSTARTGRAPQNAHMYGFSAHIC